MIIHRDKLLDENENGEEEEEDEVTSGRQSVINEETKPPMFADNQSSVQYIQESRPESKVLTNIEDELGA